MAKSNLNRRSFLKHSSAGMLGAGLIGGKGFNTRPERDNEEPPKIRGYKTLGRTGFRVSDLSLGYIFTESLAKAALNAGINLIETSEMYGRGNQERSLSNVIPDFRREDLFILSKISHRVKAYDTPEEIVARAEASLERLGTEYLDCYMIHGAETSGMVTAGA